MLSYRKYLNQISERTTSRACDDRITCTGLIYQVARLALIRAAYRYVKTIISAFDRSYVSIARVSCICRMCVMHKARIATR